MLTACKGLSRKAIAVPRKWYAKCCAGTTHSKRRAKNVAREMLQRKGASKTHAKGPAPPGPARHML